MKTLRISGLLLLLLACITLFVILPLINAKDPPIGQALSLAKQAELRHLSAMSPLNLGWQDLMPQDYIPEPQLYLFTTGFDEETVQNALDTTPIVEELDGQSISLPGFAVPLEGDENMITEFLLVPYFGACIHTPPPPANQIVHIKPRYGLLQDESWGAITVTGTLSASGSSSVYGAAGYSLEDAVVTAYVPPPPSFEPEELSLDNPLIDILDDTFTTPSSLP